MDGIATAAIGLVITIAYALIRLGIYEGSKSAKAIGKIISACDKVHYK